MEERKYTVRHNRPLSHLMADFQNHTVVQEGPQIFLAINSVSDHHLRTKKSQITLQIVLTRCHSVSFLYLY